jgi:hypothetical protein
VWHTGFGDVVNDNCLRWHEASINEFLKKKDYEIVHVNLTNSVRFYAYLSFPQGPKSLGGTHSYRKL